MGVKIDIDTAKVRYSFHRKAGRNIIEHRPVFAPDGELLSIIVENIVRVYNIQTGDCVRTLETESSVNELIAIEFPQDENYNLYGCSDSGSVTAWTWENGAILREVKLKTPNAHRIVTFNLINSNECFVISVGPKKGLCLASYSLKTGQGIQEFTKITPTFHDMIRVSLGWCNGDRFAAIIDGTRSLYIQNLYKQYIYNEFWNSNMFRILSVAAHHSTNAVAITDTLGRVTIFRGNLYDKKNIAKEVLHWHYLPPGAVCFSLQGNYLYTGGMEKVLVKWTVGNLAYKADEKAFIPRLPGMIRYITTNNTHVAITLTNNSVVVANAQMRVVATLLECGGLSPAARAVGGALALHRGLGALLMAGRTGHLQLYSTTIDKVLYNVDITQMNTIPPHRWNLLPLEIEVTCAAVSANGEWLATSEYRNDGKMYPEEKLKFWAIEVGKGTPFRLNTCVNLSHGGCNVVALAFNKKGSLCVSSGTDQKFRIWRKEKTSQNTKQAFSWICLTACYYSSGVAQFLSHSSLNDFKIGKMEVTVETDTYPYMREIEENDVIRRMFNIHKEHSLIDPEEIHSGGHEDNKYAMGGVDISQDGSLIAAWFGAKLTLWDTHSCNLRTTLSHPVLRPKGVDVLFGNEDAAHFLVCTTETCLAVWSLLSLTVKWLVNLKPSCVAADRFSNKIAVATSNNDVYIFNPHSSKPILSQKRLLDPAGGVFKKCTFGGSSEKSDEMQLYLTRNDSELYCIEPEQSAEGRLEVISRRRRPASGYGALLADQQLSAVSAPASASASAPASAAAFAQLSTAAPHMIPPVSLLCTSFLQQISGQKELQEDEEMQEPDQVIEVEEDSSDDEQIPLNDPYAPKVTHLWVPNYEAVKERKLNKIIKEPFLDLHATSEMFNL